MLVPLLTLAFHVDLRYAIGASLISVLATSSGAAAAYVREGYSNVRIGMLLEIATTLDALLGAFLAARVPTRALGRHLRRMRELYSERLGVLLELGNRHLSGMIEIPEIEAGLQTVGWLAKGLDDREAARAASERGLNTTALAHFYRSPQELARSLDSIRRR